MSTRTKDGSSATDLRSPNSVRLVRRAIPIGPDAPATARDALADVAGTIASGLLFHAQLLVSELVSQRVRIAPADSHGVLDLVISRAPGYLRVQVTDEDSRPLLVRPDPGEPILGWELQLVAELADRWGVRHDTRTTLWWELDL
jgi:hypothetical protein